MNDFQTPRIKTNKYTRRTFVQTSALAAAGVILHGCITTQSKEPLIEVLHLPKSFSHRSGELTANVSGTLSSQVTQAKYQLNNGQWLDVGRGTPRVPEPLFTIEMRAEDLRPGTNNLKIEVSTQGGEPETQDLQFEYDPEPISLPVTVEWSNADLEVQDGYWETFSDNGEWRVRPTPGFENVDRILSVTGAFPEGRRVETDLIFRSSKLEDSDLKLYGFGLLPMWGGHKDEVGVSPRRGWIYAIAWFHPYRNGGGVEFGYKDGDAAKKWVDSYRKFEPEADVRYFITAESWPELDEEGEHLHYQQRMKWWQEGEPESDEWIEVTDAEGAPLPPGEYAVALIAYDCQVDFGPVTVTTITGPEESSDI
ncbi:MAG: hypothetical protein F6K47_17480 [Symploca sp. SIO2E6]|nr:hypothetical protein [Symploca sp. SIO2E6]